MVAATENDKNGGGKPLERNIANNANSATSARRYMRALYKNDDGLNGFMESVPTEIDADVLQHIRRLSQESVLRHLLRKVARDSIDPDVDLEYSWEYCVTDMVDDEESGPVLESNEEDSEYDELRLEDNLGADFCKESKAYRNIADDYKLIENASCLEILALTADAGLKDIDLEMIGIESSWPTEISISEIAISLIGTIIYNAIFNITIFNITIFNSTIFSNTIFSMISLDRDYISRYPGDEIEISLKAGLAPAIMRAISVIIKQAIGSTSDRAPDILLLHDGGTRDELVISRDEIVISKHELVISRDEIVISQD